MSEPRTITREQWLDIGKRYGLPGPFAAAIKAVYQVWKDPTDPLESLVECFNWAHMATLEGVPASVFLGQIFLESDYGRNADKCPLGIKARQSDIESGKAVRYPTLELVAPSEVERLKANGDFIDYTGRTSKDGRLMVRCYQWFFKGNLPENFERFFRYYRIRKPKRFDLLKTGSLNYLQNVTCKNPWAYATDDKYLKSVMGIINRFQLDELDKWT